MLYLLNKNLSLEEKGLMALLLHLNEGGIKITTDTIMHYISSPLTLTHLIKEGYVDFNSDEDYTLREDNEIKE
jgi:hypothetical protein